MKRFTLSVVMTAVLGLTAYTLADAGSDRRQLRGRGFEGASFFQERGPGFGGPGRGPGGRRGGGPLMSLRGLDLNEDQQAKIKAILDAERPTGDGPPADAQLRRDLHAAIYADTVDAEKVSSLQQQLVAAVSARQTRQLAIEQQIAQILTPEQRAQVRERLARGPRGGGPRP